MKKSNRRAHQIKNRLASSNAKIIYIFIAMALFLCVLIIRLFWINIVRGESLTRAALNQLTSTEEVQADRGLILDRNHKEFVVNVTKSNVYYNMNFKRGNTYTENERKERNKSIEEDSKAIAKVLNVNWEDLKAKFKGERVVLLARNVDRDVAKTLQNLKLSHLSVEDVQRRYYPQNSMLSETLGFVTDDGVGQYGLESRYDDALSGISGKTISIRTNTHSQIPLTEEENYAPKEGQNLILTIDGTIQKICESIADATRIDQNAEEVNIIVQNVKTGDILAMVSSQSYDANNPKNPVGEEQERIWDGLSDGEKTDTWYKNWSNYNVSSQFEPGSTFKVFTAAAALEQATTYPMKEYYCPGYYDAFKDAVIKCSSTNRGKKTMEQAMIESCNVTLINMANELGKDSFLNYIKSFGFGERTGIDLPAEAVGTVPKKASDISGVNLATMSYGHGVAVTPIQLINSFTAIVNGGDLLTPKIADSLEDRSGNVIKKFEPQIKRKIISEQTSQQMLDILYKVVEEGTGKKARVEGYKIGGKTGTAYIPSEAGGYEDAYISSFLGVAPVDNPEISVLVVVQKPVGNFYAATVAAPAAGEVFEKTLEHLGVKREVKEATDGEAVSVPNLMNRLVSDAGRELVDLGLKFNTNVEDLSDASVVVKQTPNPETVVSQGSIVDLFVSTKEAPIMPDLTGMSKKEAQQVLKDLDVSYNMKGEGYVVDQSVQPGTKLKEGTVITFEMSEQISSTDTKDSGNETHRPSEKTMNTASETMSNTTSNHAHHHDIGEEPRNASNEE
ncbi:penicillin-binding transpeptidase domain-containing protein [Peptoniphilus equinus]|uniref:Penicillin-binding transpeptidase domain-containing protein n=1 Tax=Peptoniphilus equinus TaxID=3016343 RepID=A0ABY7QR70_9FIRM|nr:penicillin-binding transpeptidase domain-containing protein [Peptoniphilus equinus]WBW49272.1 penicillin-binding transpeptidase domain-containing protein [Peptoniphilus equinus]